MIELNENENMNTYECEIESVKYELDTSVIEKLYIFRYDL